jgi:predicted cobalt transporter CbtA
MNRPCLPMNRPRKYSMVLVTLFAAPIGPNMPAGEHDNYVWHERLGQQQTLATIPSNGKTAVTFEFHQCGSDYEHREQES